MFSQIWKGFQQNKLNIYKPKKNSWGAAIFFERRITLPAGQT